MISVVWISSGDSQFRSLRKSLARAVHLPEECRTRACPGHAAWGRLALCPFSLIVWMIWKPACTACILRCLPVLLVFLPHVCLHCLYDWVVCMFCALCMVRLDNCLKYLYFALFVCLHCLYLCVFCIACMFAPWVCLHFMYVLRCMSVCTSYIIALYHYLYFVFPLLALFACIACVCVCCISLHCTFSSCFVYILYWIYVISAAIALSLNVLLCYMSVCQQGC